MSNDRADYAVPLPEGSRISGRAAEFLPTIIVSVTVSIRRVQRDNRSAGFPCQLVDNSSGAIREVALQQPVGDQTTVDFRELF